MADTIGVLVAIFRNKAIELRRHGKIRGAFFRPNFLMKNIKKSNNLSKNKRIYRFIR